MTGVIRIELNLRIIFCGNLDHITSLHFFIRLCEISSKMEAKVVG